jgi:hypothetical protein
MDVNLSEQGLLITISIKLCIDSTFHIDLNYPLVKFQSLTGCSVRPEAWNMLICSVMMNETSEGNIQFYLQIF